jgi:hypothetical protein
MTDAEQKAELQKMLHNFKSLQAAIASAPAPAPQVSFSQLQPATSQTTGTTSMNVNDISQYLRANPDALSNILSNVGASTGGK